MRGTVLHASLGAQRQSSSSPGRDRLGHMTAFVASCVPTYIYTPRESSSAFFFTLLLQSRPNTPPWVNLISRFSRAESLGIPLDLPSRTLCSSIEEKGGLSWKTSEGLLHATCVRSVIPNLNSLISLIFHLLGNFRQSHFFILCKHG